MNTLRILTVLLLGSCGAGVAAPGPAPPATAGDAAYAAVDPFIGTGGDGHTFPGAVVPFGMIQLSPDTQISRASEAYGWAAGYRYEDHTIVGFSHTHFSGTGHSDLGDVLVMPIAGEVRFERGDVDKPGSGYTSRFSHASEMAQPGYYAVTLDRLRRARRAHRGGARRRAPLHLPARQARARAHRPAHQHLRLPGQGAVVAPAAAAGRHRDRFSRDARLGAGPAAVLRAALLAGRSAATSCATREGRHPLQGLPAAGGHAAARARADRGPPAGRACSISRRPQAAR